MPGHSKGRHDSRASPRAVGQRAKGPRVRAEGHSPLPPFSTRALDGGALTWGALSWRVLCCLGQLFHVEATAFAFIHTSPSFFTPKSRLSGTLGDLAPALLPPPPPASLLPQYGRGIQKQHLAPPQMPSPPSAVTGFSHPVFPKATSLQDSAPIPKSSQEHSRSTVWDSAEHGKPVETCSLPTAWALPFPGLGWLFGGVTTIGGPE